MLDNELEAKEAEIAQTIEKAFSDTSYPGDQKIIPLYNNSPHCNECAELAEKFRGKGWKDISLPILFSERNSLSLFTPEAFRFYLPAYLRAAVLYPSEMDTLTENVFYNLAPPAEDGIDMDRFLNRIKGFSPQQQIAIRSFVELYVIRETTYPDPSRDRATKFWERLQ